MDRHTRARRPERGNCKFLVPKCLAKGGKEPAGGSTMPWSLGGISPLGIGQRSRAAWKWKGHKKNFRLSSPAAAFFSLAVSGRRRPIWGVEREKLSGGQ